MSKTRKVWGVTTPQLPASMIAAMAKQMEDDDLIGVFAPQVLGPPFIPLAAAATSTTRLQLASGIALAFARSPFETAMAAIDLDRMSGGRFVLGLGPSVKAWSEALFGQPYGKPLAHLREVIDVVRLIVAKGHTSELTAYHGDYVDIDFTFFPPLTPPVRTEIPIWIAALRGPLVKLGAEIADGVIGHPIWSRRWIAEQVPGWIDEGLAKGGRQREDIEVNIWPFVAIDDDVQAALDAARPTVAFYASAEQYGSYFEWHGWGEVVSQLHQRVEQGDVRTGHIAELATLVPDEMVRDFFILGPRDECLAQLEEIWEVADSITPVPPTWGTDMGGVLQYTGRIAEALYPGSAAT
jgi:probable F420-dependent oxidoreductase